MTLDKAKEIMAEVEASYGPCVDSLDSPGGCILDGWFTTEQIEAVLIVRKSLLEKAA